MYTRINTQILTSKLDDEQMEGQVFLYPCRCFNSKLLQSNLVLDKVSVYQLFKHGRYYERSPKLHFMHTITLCHAQIQRKIPLSL